VLASDLDGHVRRSFALGDSDERDLEDYVDTYTMAGFSVALGYFGFSHEARGKG